MPLMAAASAQLEVNRQYGLTGHGNPSGRGRTEAGAQHGLAGGLVEAVAGRLENIDGCNLSGRVERNLQHHSPFLAQTPSLARVLGHDHPRDGWPSRGPETEQTALAPSGTAPLTARAPACAGPASLGRYSVASRTGCANAAARGAASPRARNGSDRNGCGFTRGLLSVMSWECFIFGTRGFRLFGANGFRLRRCGLFGSNRFGCDRLWFARGRGGGTDRP